MIKDLQQSRGRITFEILADLVNLVKHYKRVS